MIKIRKRILSIVLAVCFVLSLSSCDARCVQFEELNIPTAERFATGERARCACDAVFYDGKLYIGSGDYGVNTAPTDIWCYDEKKEKWINSGSVRDETIGRFVEIDGKIVAPGTDPRDDWTFGNYYVLEEDGWQTIRTIPGGIHNFDMVKFGGKLFVALGVLQGEMPVACSSDGGKTFERVPFYKDGKLIDTTGEGNVRVYELFTLKGKLYALYREDKENVVYDLYRYDGTSFVFDNKWSGKLKSTGYGFNIVNGKFERDGRLFFATGYLYVTEDMNVMTQIKFPEVHQIRDLYEYNNRLYALGVSRINEQLYRISVWRNKGASNDGFIELLYFEYELPPTCFAYSGDNFYFCMGDNKVVHEKNGMVLKVEF